MSPASRRRENARIYAVFRGRRIKVDGFISDVAHTQFRRAASKLLALYTAVTGEAASGVSDGDVLEYVLRGHTATRRYLSHRQKEQA